MGSTNQQLKLRSFASTDRFIAEIAAAAASNGALKPAYIFAGDEVFLYERLRKAIIASFVDPALRDFSVIDLDLENVGLFEVLDRARTQSLMAPFQVIFVKNLKNLYKRGSKKEEFAAVKAYCKSPNPQALLLFLAGHLHIPSDVRKMDWQDKEKYERIRETLGDDCGIVELARIEETDAARWAIAHAEERGVKLDADAARELADALGADMMTISSETEKLILYAGDRQRITLADVEVMVLAAKQRSMYEMTDAISSKDKARAVALLHGLLNASDGGEDSAIGHLYMLARTFRQMVVILEKNVRDSRSVWQALWQGFRMPPFAADDIIRQARRYKSPREVARALRLIARADLELRSSPPDKRLILEQLVLELASQQSPKAKPAQMEYVLEP